jgi:hypothetical protein
MSSIESSGLEDLNSKLNKVLDEFPGKRRELHETAADIMHENVIKNIKSETKHKTGNLERGQKKVVGSGGGYAAVTPDYSIAPHTHLIENGHKLVKKINGSKKIVGFVNGKHMYQKAIAQSESQLINAAEKFAEEIVEAFT